MMTNEKSLSGRKVFQRKRRRDLIWRWPGNSNRKEALVRQHGATLSPVIGRHPLAHDDDSIGVSLVTI